MTPALILGAAVWPNGPSPTLLRRALQGALLWREGRASHLIACGGLGKHGPSEAEMISDILQDEGVPRERILLEDQSTNTLDNIRLALPLLEGLGPDIYIVTDHPHAPRAKMVARHFGLRPIASCPPLKCASLKVQARQVLREIPAIVVYKMRLARL